jgi:hypothetical protein
MTRAPTLEFAFEARVRVAPPIEGGAVPGGRRRIIPILGGAVDGPLLQASVVPGGADWQVVQPDGLTDLVARYTLQAADGTYIGVVNRGVRHGPPEVMRRLLAGEAVDPAEIYFRCTPVFEAPPGPHAWLARHVFTATGERHPDGVVIRVFVVR